MRRTLLSLLAVAFVASACAAFEETTEALKVRFESASPDARAELGIRIAQARLRDADELYKEGHVDQARAAVDDIVAYSEKARDAAIASGKHLKNCEISARKMAEKLRDIKRTLNLEDQSPLDQAVRRLENVRTTLLNEMFQKKEKK
jgi:ParB-like chromosome segregation protein Spo0J